MSKKNGTYMIDFGDEQIVFGNNYKPWWQHAVEYIYYNRGDQESINEFGWQYMYVSDVVKAVKYSNQQFYDDGGLKWCSLDTYQEVVDDVCKSDELVPIKVNDIVFRESPADQAVLTKKLRAY